MDEVALRCIPQVGHQELELQRLTLVRWEVHGEVAWTLHRTCHPTVSPLGVLHVLTKKFRWKRALCRHKTQLHYAWAVGFPLLPAPLDSYQEVWKLHIPNEKQKIFIIKSEMFQCNWLLADFKVCLSDPHAAKPTQYNDEVALAEAGDTCDCTKTCIGFAFCCLQGCWFT